MDKKRKSILGLKDDLILPSSGKIYSDSQKHFIIQEYLKSGLTKTEIWKKFTGQTEEHGQILRWMRKFGYDTPEKRRSPNFAKNPQFMAKKEHDKEFTASTKDFEVLQLQKRIAELESSLKDAEMKSIAYSTMVDIAEKEFNIPIRKKYNTKPSKK